MRVVTPTRWPISPKGEGVVAEVRSAAEAAAA